MRVVALAALLVACGNSSEPPAQPDASAPPIDAAPVGSLFGESCPTSSTAQLEYLCHDGAGACVSGAVCRPFCRDASACAAIGGMCVHDSSAYVCVPAA